MGLPIITRILAAANRAQSRLAGGRIVCEQDGARVELEATYGGRKEESQDTTSGAITRLQFSDRDFIVAAADLVFNGKIAKPKDGMRIMCVDAGEKITNIFEAMPIPGRRCWEGCDSQEVLIRIHTKKVQSG